MIPRVDVLDFGMGNLRSVAKAIERAGARVEVVEDVDAAADALVVPGQGAFGSCVLNLGPRLERVRAWIEQGRPFLGICLGLQVLFEGSEEAPQPGLGVLQGMVVRLPGDVKVPHIGWNEVMPRMGACLFEGIDAGTRFYFVHSYYPEPKDETVSAATTDYGDVTFSCAVERDAVMATQFHPEKSGDAGLALLHNFVEACRS
jgi:imidazole glycerol phosphate synthase glutamine amidotransferase subunit